MHKEPSQAHCSCIKPDSKQRKGCFIIPKLLDSLQKLGTLKGMNGESLKPALEEHFHSSQNHIHICKLKINHISGFKLGPDSREK